MYIVIIIIIIIVLLLYLHWLNGYFAQGVPSLFLVGSFGKCTTNICPGRK